MAVSDEHTKLLLKLIADTQSDSMDCDECFEQLAEFVEMELAGTEIPEAMKKVQRHLDQCACCNDEHNALLEGLQALQG